MTTRIAISAMFAGEGHFATLRMTAEGPLQEFRREVLGTHLRISDGKLYWHFSDGRAVVLERGYPDDEPDFGCCSDGPEAVSKNEDTYFAACATRDQWLGTVPEGAALPLYWWSATENYFNERGKWVGLGATITAPEARIDRPETG